MTREALWISEQEVAELIDLPDTLAALERGFCAEGSGSALAMDKTMATFGDHATLHALGAVFETAATEGGGVVGTKTWAHTPGGADPQLLLFSAVDGGLVAVIEAFALGQLRTAGTAGLATGLLARRDAVRLAMIGTGKQALGQIAAVCCVRHLDEVACFGRDQDKASRFASEVERELSVRCSVAPSVSEAVADADIVTLATRARQPILTAADVRPGTHVNAIGAIALDRSEFEPGLLDRCAVVATDSVAQCRQLSAELRSYYGEDPSGTRDWSSLQTLAGLVASGRQRPEDADVTVFKAMGSGIEDLAVGIAVLERARATGLGRPIPRAGRARPRLAPPRPGAVPTP